MMIRALIRRLGLLMLAFALVAGAGLPPAQAAGMAVSAVVVEAPGADGCGGCDDHGERAVACQVACAGLAALADAPLTTGPKPAPVAFAMADVRGEGLAPRPEPFPPRSAS